MATVSNTDPALLGQFFSQPVGQNVLQAKDNDTAFLGKPGRFRILYPVNLEARYLCQAAQSPLFRLYTLAAAVITLPAALVATGFEVAARAGGTIYVEARREPDQEPAATA